MLQLQQACFENIKSLCTNFKKDSASRKTQDYLQKRLSSLDSQWKDFEERHGVLTEEITDKNIKYFTEDIYSKTKMMYETNKAEMESLLHQLLKQEEITFDLTGVLDENTEDKVRLLLTKQESNFKAITRAMSKININTIREKWELEDHLSILKTKWDAIDKLHWALEAELKGDNDRYYNTFVNIESQYDEMKKMLNNKIWSTVHYQQSAPRIEVPEFSGSYHHWISFKDLFQETIHNNPTINKAQKMQHLKTKLRGEAHRLVQHLTISADNYDSCWSILNQRYDNRRLQFSSYMNTMLNLPIIQHPDAHNLKKTHDVIMECLNGLSNIGLDTSTWDPIIVHLMSQKLDSGTYNEYMKDLQHQQLKELPNLNDFLYFLENKFMAYENMKSSKKDNYNPKQLISKPFNKQVLEKKQYHHDFNKTYHKTYFTGPGNCPLCDGSHVLMQCPNFFDMDSFKQNHTVARLAVCRNCLYSHGNEDCKSTKTCKECDMKHHTMLHYVERKPQTNNNSGPRPSTSNQQQSSNHLSTNEREVLLTTIQLKVKSFNGTYITLRALLDQGSQVNLITENAAQLLRLPRKKLNATISGVGSASEDCKGRLELKCKSLYSDYTFHTEAMVIKKLVNNLPNSTFEKANWPHLESLKLADPEFNVSRGVDLLLGADVYSDIILDGVLKGKQQSPIAQNTHLGWILCGKLKTFNCHATLVDLHELTKFWETEDITKGHEDISNDDQCEKYYRETTVRNPDGKYVVKIPLCPDFEQKLGKSKSVAVSQFLQLEKRLQRQNKLASRYRDFIHEYIDLQHMVPSSPRSSSNLECYLPHHGVLRESSATTKLRVVYNASQKTSTGYSLNDLMEKGPNLQKDIQSLIIKWRSYKYVYTADIEKMYRCIWISIEQQPLQKIIWRDAHNDRLPQKLQELQLCTVTYGTKCAPWLAMRTLKQLALDDGHKYPEAAKILQNEFYVDDLVSGHNSLKGAKNLQQSLIKLLKGGGMNLRKWSSNDPILLENLTKDQISSTNSFDFKHEEPSKTLGLAWNPETDTFMFNWTMEEKTNKKLTKRTLLSEISKLYDPPGWLSPITVSAKLLFQRVWTSKIGWDYALPEDIQNEWLKIKSELPDVKDIQISRWIGSTNKQLQLLAFSDASEKAYACVIYCRVAADTGNPIVTLLTAKTRVVPLSQKTTLPRLELCGALLLSRLMEKVVEALHEHELTIHAWCDSKVVLAWLQGETSRWEKYVANRVAKIKNIIPAQQWHYVKSEENPADCASRGLYPSKLINFDLWWEGPGFTKTFNEQDVKDVTVCLYKTSMGAVNKKSCATLTPTVTENFITKLLNNCSSLSYVTRVTAWIIRFITNIRKRMQKTQLSNNDEYLSSSELNESTELVIKCVQQQEFMQEYKDLIQNKEVLVKSNLHRLRPYLDSKGIIRVGGRLNNSDLPFNMKNPMILPHNGRLTQLVIDHAHLRTLHGGARLTLSYIRQMYWIIGGNRAVKTHLRHCVRCHRFKPAENYQLMGDLPKQRTTPSRPFTHTGVDFTGHVDVKLNKGRGVKTSKGYIVIFVCMATKAVHIELASDLSTETFIGAFKRPCVPGVELLNMSTATAVLTLSAQRRCYAMSS